MTNDTMFQEAVRALRQGDKAGAKEILTRLLQSDNKNVKYWLWMSETVESTRERIYCLQTVLKLDPENTAAINGLTLLGKLRPAKFVQEPHRPVTSLPPKSIPVSAREISPRADTVSLHPRQKFSIKRLNWYLIFGVMLVLFMISIAIFGPALAPQDPMKENYALTAYGIMHTPPYGVMEAPGYVLGTDRFGRDLLSRILWGVRPTLIMVITVAGIRLLIGVVLGMITGWQEGRKGRILDSVLSAALSIPVLIAAIAGIFIVGIDKGLWAFLIGLGLTGWAESARMVSEQTRAIKHQVFVEAARALGASDRRVLYVHVLRQIMSMVWMLLAFEISSTLLVSAELGFLGYYIGGGIWIEITDFAVVNAEGLPELGQMLASSLVKITDPSALIVVGSVVCAGVLGFNLLGEGLRLQLSQERLRGGRRFGILPVAFEEWLDVRVLHPISIWMEVNRRFVWSAIVLLILGAGGWMIFKTVYFRPIVPETTSFEVQGGHLWSGERYDAFGTLWVPSSMETEPQFLWKVPIPGGPSGKPVVNKDGTVIVAGLEKVLIAIDPNGNILWQTPLNEVPVGTPALDAGGQIYLADNKGGVTALDPTGNLLWRTQASNGRNATSGPVLDDKGNIYLTIIDEVAALSPQGELMWRTKAADVYLEEAPRLSSDQSMVFLKNSAIKTGNGARVSVTIGNPQEYLFSDPSYFTGADGKDYYRLGHEIIGWRLNGENLETDEGITWQYNTYVLFTPYEQGVTPNKLYWMYYATSYADGRMVWLDGQSRVVGNYRFTFSNSKLIAIGEKDEAYICSSTGARVVCINIPPGVDTPAWTVYIEDAPSALLGGVFVPGRIYISLDKNGIYAIGTNETGAP
jgi:peptide/nickel transport system permease protein